MELFVRTSVSGVVVNVSQDDATLIALCLSGDTSSFGVLVRRYQDRLYNSVYRLVDHPDDAQDVVQEAFLNAYQSLESFKGDALFFTWLYRIAFNTAISLKRKQRVTLSIDASQDSDGHGIDPHDPADDAHPGWAMEQAEQERKIHAALVRLSSEHRTVLVMKDMEGRKYEDMAELLDVPIGTIRSRLHRARLELRQLLEQDEGL
jgi:RNA polymerase sigma-70 factor (ECF subfamily)